MTVTTASAALTELVQTMKAMDGLFDKPLPLSDADDKMITQLEDRMAGLERQLVAEVRDKLGVDYGVLWQAVTPTKSNGAG